MQCINCKGYRHDGPCEPVYDDEPSDLELLQIDFEQAQERYMRALVEHHKERGHHESV